MKILLRVQSANNNVEFFLNSELANKKNDKGSKVSFLKIGSLEINHPGDIANALNDFLVDIAENIK